MIKISKIGLLKFFDKVVGGILVFLFRNIYREKVSYPKEISKILVIRPGGIGDAVLLIPAVIALKKKHPNAKVDVLAEKRNGSVFSMCPEINGIFLYDKPKELLSAIRAKYDVVIDAEQWHRLSAIVTRLINAPMRIGYATNERKMFFTHAMDYSHDDGEIASFHHLVAPLLDNSIPVVVPPFLSIPGKASEAIKLLLQPLTGTRFVAVFPGGSIQERRWGKNRFRAVAKKLILRGYSIVVVGGEEDVSACRDIADDPHQSINVCGKLSLIETAAVLKEASLLITGDSGIMHIGYGLGIKVVALFGPGIEKKWAPRGENVAVINKHLPCSPCTKFGYTPRCNKGAECMKQITVDEVYEKAIALLER